MTPWQWKETATGYYCEPYAVRLISRKWVAQRNVGKGHPQHVGSYTTAQEAREACEKAGA